MKHLGPRLVVYALHRHPLQTLLAAPLVVAHGLTGALAERVLREERR